MRHKLSRSNEGCSENEIAQFESTIGFGLPLEYRLFLRDANGGVPCSQNCLYLYRSFVRPSRTSTGSIGRWLSLNGHLGITECIKNMGGMLPRGYLPIAELASGDPLVLCALGDRSGYVYQVEFDYIDEGDSPQTILSLSFGGFLSILQDMNDLESIVQNGVPCNQAFLPV